ncbi:AsnC family protein [Amycolatopsis sp.]|uniref:AsnC family protein n=1 Tax=Amycolatopsis sp. TaxID=37632 RepID=UPI002C3534C2|nr:AsnC family protein [Amycolatopsis sp.]HVV10586.1 AsnC family protein [Amycolatopsis sp.]
MIPVDFDALQVEVAKFDDLDRRLVHALQLDARAPFNRVAAVLGAPARRSRGATPGFARAARRACWGCPIRSPAARRWSARRTVSRTDPLCWNGFRVRRGWRA